MTLRHLALPLLLTATVVLPAQDQKIQAVALVKEAAEYGRLHGRPALLRETNMGSGRFHVKPGKDLYVFVFDQNGFALAHGAQSNMVNINRLESKDPDGKFFIKEIIHTAVASGSGWVDYKYSNPKTGKVEAKASS
jgi:hypothetical protein